MYICEAYSQKHILVLTSSEKRKPTEPSCGVAHQNFAKILLNSGKNYKNFKLLFTLLCEYFFIYLHYKNKVCTFYTNSSLIYFF